MSMSNIGNQFSYNLTPQQRQAIGMALLSQAGQPIQNTGGPISPLSVLAKVLQSYSGMKMLQAKQAGAQAPMQEQQSGEPLSDFQNQADPVSGFNPMSPEDSQEIALGDGAAPADALWNGGGAAMGKAMADSALTS